LTALLPAPDTPKNFPIRMILSSLRIDDFTLAGEPSKAIERWNSLYASLHCGDPLGVSRDLQIRTKVDFRELHFFACALEARLFLITCREDRLHATNPPFYFGLEFGLSPGNFDIYVYVTGDGKKPTGFHPLTAVVDTKQKAKQPTETFKGKPEFRVLDIADYGPIVYFIPSLQLQQGEFDRLELNDSQTGQEVTTIKITVGSNVLKATIKLTNGTFAYRPLAGLFEAFGQTPPVFENQQPTGALPIGSNSKFAFVSASLQGPIVVLKRTKTPPVAIPADAVPAATRTALNTRSSPRSNTKGWKGGGPNRKTSTAKPVQQNPVQTKTPVTTIGIRTLKLSPANEIASFRDKIPKLTGEDVATSPLIPLLHSHILSKRMTSVLEARENDQTWTNEDLDPNLPVVVPLPAPVINGQSCEDRTFYTLVPGADFVRSHKNQWNALKAQEKWGPTHGQRPELELGLSDVRAKASFWAKDHRESALKLLRDHPIGQMRITNPIVERRFSELSSITSIKGSLTLHRKFEF
jgi:hypothetical protein